MSPFVHDRQIRLDAAAVTQRMDNTVHFIVQMHYTLT